VPTIGDFVKKRNFLHAALTGAIASAGSTAMPAYAQHGPKASSGPILLTVSGLIGAGNRGALDPALDQLMAKQKISFSKAHAFDFAMLTSMTAVTIKPTLEYDNKQHTLRGPLLMDVLKASGVKTTEKTALLLRAIDGYAALLPAAEVMTRRFILATHLDGRPMALGGLGPLWAVFDADRFPDMVVKPVTERFSSCPWATYHVEVKDS
jgi:hypothetical protein